MKFPPFEHEFGHDAQDLLVRLGNARGVKVLADFAEQVTALGIDRAPGKVVRTGIGVPARACQFLSGPPARSLLRRIVLCASFELVLRNSPIAGR